jgi:DNA-directed RNA polymerase specialized sigma24 family protein
MPGNGASCIGWRAFLCDREREVLGLVLFGGLEYRQAARELAIPAPEAAALLRTALISLPALPAY